jgi:hypothetical protein
MRPATRPLPAAKYKRFLVRCLIGRHTLGPAKTRQASPSPWRVLIEIPSDQPDRFRPTPQVVSLEALQQRLGDECCFYARRLVSRQPPRSVPIERQDNIPEEVLGQEARVLIVERVRDMVNTSNRNIAQACLISRFFTNRTRKVVRVHEPMLLCYRIINDDGGTI